MFKDHGNNCSHTSPLLSGVVSEVFYNFELSLECMEWQMTIGFSFVTSVFSEELSFLVWCLIALSSEHFVLLGE